jgi:hypothetical protein
MNPPAPCAVTLPAHRPPAAHRRPRRSACRRPANRCLEFQPAPCAAIHVSAHRAPKGLARCASRHEPRSSFACPRLSASPIQPCPSPLAYVAPHRSIEPGGVPPGAAAGATQRPRCARPRRHRCERSSHGARRVGLPFGPAPATSAILPQGRSPGGRLFRAPACVRGAPRAVAASPPRFARTAPRPASANASASLTPPREPPAPFAFPSRAAAFQFCRRPATPAALPFPRRRPLASGVEWLAMLAPMTSKGTRRRALASPLAREELHCALNSTHQAASLVSLPQLTLLSGTLTSIE